MAIKFFFKDCSVIIKERKKLKKFISEMFKKEKKGLHSLTYVFCTDSYLLSINKEFLQHDEYTDIITFTLSEPFHPISGEIYISLERVMDNASRLGVNLQAELHRIIFHGALHLCGYKDKKPVDKSRMTKAEEDYLKEYFT